MRKHWSPQGRRVEEQGMAWGAEASQGEVESPLQTR